MTLLLLLIFNESEGGIALRVAFPICFTVSLIADAINSLNLLLYEKKEEEKNPKQSQV